MSLQSLIWLKNKIVKDVFPVNKMWLELGYLENESYL